MPLCLSLSICPGGLRHRWEADARVQASRQLHLSTGGGRDLAEGKTGGGLRDVVIVEFQVNVTRVEWDQGNWIMNRCLIIKEILNISAGDICQGETVSVDLYHRKVE